MIRALLLGALSCWEQPSEDGGHKWMPQKVQLVLKGSDFLKSKPLKELKLKWPQKYLGIIIGQNLSFKGHIFKCLSLHLRKHFVYATFLFLYWIMNLCGQYLKRLDTIYHCAVCFTAGHENLAHQSSLYTGAK